MFCVYIVKMFIVVAWLVSMLRLYCENPPRKESQQWKSVEKRLFEGVPTREVDQKVDGSIEDLLIDFISYLI